MAYDTEWDNVIFLTGFNGTDSAQNFSDDSKRKNVLTAGGTAQFDTAQFKFGTSSALFDGVNGTDIDWPDDTAVIIAAQDFTIESWIRFNGAPSGTSMSIASHYNSTANKRSFDWRHESANTMDFRYSVTGSAVTTYSVAWTPAADTWYHVAVCRSGADLRMFVDGTQIGTTHNIGTSILFNSNAPLRLGALDSGGTIQQVLDGWIDEARWTVGSARYTTNFTAPTAAFPRGGNVLEVPKMNGYAVLASPRNYSVEVGKMNGYVVMKYREPKTRVINSM